MNKSTESKPEFVETKPKAHYILIQSHHKLQPVNYKHFHRIEIKNGEEFHLYHQLILINHQLGLFVLYCPICDRFLQHSEDKIEPISQSEENGGWT